MKLRKETIVYIYVAVLFILAFLFTWRLMKNIRSGEFEYFRLGINFVLLVYIIIKVVKLGKEINDKNDTDGNG